MRGNDQLYLHILFWSSPTGTEENKILSQDSQSLVEIQYDLRDYLLNTNQLHLSQLTFGKFRIIF